MKITASRHKNVSSQIERQKRLSPSTPNFGSRKKCALALFLSILIVCLITCLTNESLAQDGGKVEERDIIVNGKTIVTLRFSTEIDANEQDAVYEAAKYWVEVTNPLYGGAVFEVVKADDLEKNAAAISLIDNTIQTNGINLKVTGVQSILADGKMVNEVIPDENGGYRYRTTQEIAEGIRGAHAQILIGTGWDTTDNKSQSGAINNNLLPVLIHEIGHALGMTTSMKEINSGTEDNPKITWTFDNTITRWDNLLHDNDGDEAKKNQTIGHSSITNNKNVFELGNTSSTTNPSNVTFFGTNAMKVYYDNNQELINKAGKTGGVPVTGYVPIINEDDEVEWGIDASGTLSHFDTWYSLLSWQDFRNYQGLIELEMAAFKDLGYANIETRNFFGQSFYVSGSGDHGLNSTQQIAERGFGLWNGSSYDTNTANTGTFGVGVHLFGNNLNILQKGTINSVGAGGAGIRVDGVGNYITTDSNSVIKMSQDNGIGLLVAFGKEHVVVHRGTIFAYADNYSAATANATQNGIAASFDFGLQLFVSEEDIANDGVTSYLRSYYVNPDTGKRLTATNGPLVRRFDVTGKLYGSQASIYISKTAHVDQINLMKGTEIAGNIISYYKSGNLGTSLNFGLLPDESGQATASSDDTFRFVLTNHINYDSSVNPSLVVPTDGNFDIGICGGITNFNNIRVNSRLFQISSGATLLLGSSGTPLADGIPYTRLSSTNIIMNDGTLAGTGEIRMGIWDFEDFTETTDETTTGSENSSTTTGWSEAKTTFWKYSLPKGDDGYEKYFTATDNLMNNGVISPGKISGSIVEGDVGQFTVGQIDIHGGLTLTNASIYNLTIDGIPTDNSGVGKWAIDNDAIWVNGTTIMKGKLRVFMTQKFQDELKNLPNDDPVTYHIIRSGSFSSSPNAKFDELEFGGNFSDVKISGVYVNPYDKTVAQITLFPNPHYFEEKGVSWNTRSVGRAIDSATWDAPDIAFSLLGSKDDPATINNVLHQVATDVRANSIMSG
ncbi:MAG: hypothetical protein LBB88_02940, partial [Planctomycetaceae bacterium]|nr:hypothetical protein [Planctomycetaceae bacterium]